MISLTKMLYNVAFQAAMGLHHTDSFQPAARIIAAGGSICPRARDRCREVSIGAKLEPSR